MDERNALAAFNVTRLIAAFMGLGAALLLYEGHYVLGSLAVVLTLILGVTTAIFWDWATG